MPKLVGIGTDIVKNDRIKKALLKKGFIDRIYSKKEIQLVEKKRNKVSFFAKRFGAKEAFVKALGSGFRYGISFKDINVLNDKNGKPKIVLNQKLKDVINKKFNMKKINIHVSLSDEKKYSLAFVVIDKKL